MKIQHLPLHETAIHPHTGEPLRALYVRADGRVMWPMIGASPDDDTSGGGGSGSGSGDQGGANGGGQGGTGQGGTGSGQGAGSGSGSSGGSRTNATDAQGNDLGFPKDTPVAEMNDKEQAAYWRDKSRKHEGRFKDFIGDRDPAEVKKDLDAYAQIQKDQQTPAEQAITEARDAGRAEGVKAERAKAAEAIFRGALEAGGITGDDADELVTNFNVAGYITDDGIDTTKIANFAKRFHTSGKDDSKDRRRDFGGGTRREHQAQGFGSAGKAEAQRRFAKKTTSGE